MGLTPAQLKILAARTVRKLFSKGELLFQKASLATGSTSSLKERSASSRPLWVAASKFWR
jgi:hypothetical protein